MFPILHLGPIAIQVPIMFSYYSAPSGSEMYQKKSMKLKKTGCLNRLC